MKGKTVFLRILEFEDIPQTQKWINDPIISDIMGYLPVLSLVNQQDWFKGIQSDRSRFIFAICDLQSGTHIGNIGLGKIDYIHRHCMLNIFISEVGNRSKGIGTEATTLALAFAFNRLNLNKVYLQTSERFVAANKMYKKLGFVKEGVMRQHYFSNGNYEDKILYSILNDEYKLHQ